ncbi:hypothetical protein GGR56DRAFT_471449 [Xylariaceae sp. FL0804]|nr:hypothetical protein GGR56DRAFT_471449 [Xylariaceae sp. FL0804]
MPSPTRSHGAAVAASSHSPTSRPHKARNNPRIILASNPKLQEAYNRIRQEADRHDQSIREAAKSKLLPAPSAVSMSRSTTNESYSSRSPTHSHAGELEPQTPQDPPAESAAKPKRPRGKRKGPLNHETRIYTNVKRKLRLACEQHRSKKTSCDCYDFSELEEVYQRSLADNAGPSDRQVEEVHQRALPANIAPADRQEGLDMAVGYLGTFGTGGAALTPSDQDMEMNELASPFPLPTNMRPSVRPILTFDIDSEQSVNEMTQASTAQTYYPGGTTSIPMEDSPFPIGSEMFRSSNRWQCEFKSPTDTLSQASSECCSWTGSFWGLLGHFQEIHQPFEDGPEPRWFKCDTCGYLHPGWDSPECRCLNSSWRKWYYGTMGSVSGAASRQALPQSADSESGYSWNPRVSSIPPWPNDTKPSGGHLASSQGNGGFSEHSSDSRGVSDTCHAASVKYTDSCHGEQLEIILPYCGLPLLNAPSYEAPSALCGSILSVRILSAAMSVVVIAVLDGSHSSLMSGGIDRTANRAMLMLVLGFTLTWAMMASSVVWTICERGRQASVRLVVAGPTPEVTHEPRDPRKSADRTRSVSLSSCACHGPTRPATQPAPS